MAEKETNKVDEIRSDEVQEILSAVPNWMIRWGITLLFGLILMVLFISWFVKYPDVVSGDLTLTTQSPASRLVSQTNGYINAIHFANNSEVKKGDVIAVIKNPIRSSSLDSLKEALLIESRLEKLNQLKSLSDLGGLQTEINNLTNSLVEFENLSNSNYFDKDIKNVSTQIEYNNRLAWITHQELELLQNEMKNARVKYKADSSLFADSVIAKVEFFKNQSEYFAKKQQLINTKKTYVQHKITVANLEKLQNETLRNNEDQLRQLENAILASERNIYAYLDTWQESFVLTATTNGEVVFLSNLNENDFVTAQQPLFAIVPNKKEMIGVIKIKGQAFGKVEKGQKVRMKFANYPYQEFGQLLGKVAEVSSIPTEEGYFIKVELIDGLNTTYKKQIEYQPEMAGVGEIITEDLRLLERIFNNFKKIMDK